MPHVITQPCCSDASCVYACPVNCIQPTPDDPAFATAEMLHIDPATCVDCGACVSACPVDAITPHLVLSPAERRFEQINAEYFRGWPGGHPRPLLAPLVPALRIQRRVGPLRVAVVGSGPAGMYAADELLTIPGTQVTVYERLTQPFGLARFGVAPDHVRTRQVRRQLAQILDRPQVTLIGGVQVGVDITHEDLLAAHDAVVYAVGASSDRHLDVPGAELPHVASATDFVGWYNGHPDHAGASFDLSHERVVVIGNGNVALDVARILALDPDVLADTEIAPAALSALRASRVREVVVAGRRGPEHSAFTLPELVGLAAAPGIALVADLSGHDLDAVSPKVQLLRELQHGRSHGRRIVLRWGLRAERIDADGVDFGSGRIGGGLVLTSIGYRGLPVPGLPFDDARGTVPNDRGRVAPGVYVTGWIKRGPTGFIGTNKACAQETVRMLVDDANAGLLRPAAVPRGTAETAAAAR